MPCVCRWAGVKIVLYSREIGRHNAPHFHVICAEHSASVKIGTEEVFEGDLPPRQLREVLAWAAAHREELTAAWGRAAGPPSAWSDRCMSVISGA
jgi:hypothetical protein